MSIRLMRIVLLAGLCALVLSACGLSPLPDLPSGRDSNNGTGSGTSSGTGGLGLSTGGTLVVDEPPEGGGAGGVEGLGGMGGTLK